MFARRSASPEISFSMKQGIEGFPAELRFVCPNRSIFILSQCYEESIDHREAFYETKERRGAADRDARLNIYSRSFRRISKEGRFGKSTSVRIAEYALWGKFQATFRYFTWSQVVFRGATSVMWTSERRCFSSVMAGARGNGVGSGVSEIGSRQFVAQRRGTSRICLLSALSRLEGGLGEARGSRQGRSN